MSAKNLLTLAIFLGTIGAFFWGCQSSNRPVTPYQSVALNVAIPPTNELRASLLGAASNELLYRVDGPNHTLLTQGTVGPFSTSASSGSIDFSATVPALDSMILSVQLNDTSTHQPLAVGATGLNMISAPVTDVLLEMGSVTRNCYTLNVAGGGNFYNTDIYTFTTDNLIGNAAGVAGDFQFNYSVGSSNPLTLTGGPASLSGPPLPNIAYLGNGNLVDFDYLPSASAFVTTSDLAKGSPLSLGDIFCIELLSPVTVYGVPVTATGGHAWLQITNLGNGTLYVGPSFRYRVNSTLPYYGYEQTLPDQAATCSTSW